MIWNYSAKTHCWEVTTYGCQAIAQRAPNDLNWEAAIELLDDGV